MITYMISELSQEKQAQLQLSNVLPPMYLSIEKYGVDPKVKAAIYDIEVGIQQNQTVTAHVVHRRFSALNDFDKQIRSQFSDSHYLLQFPPKTLFSNTSPEFLEQRSEQLQRYLANLIKIPGLSSSPTFTQFFEIDNSV